MAWRTLLALGLVTFAASGCTTSVTVNGTNDGGPDAATGGGGGTGGTGTGGGGGTGGTGTGGSQGGTGGGGGTGGAQGDGAAVCNPAADTDACIKCLDTFCCQEYNDCVDDACHGTDDAGANGQFSCMVTCLKDGLAGLDGGFATRADCADKCKGSSAVLAVTTRDLISCMVAPVGDGSTAQRCGQVCFGGEPQ